MHKPGAPLNVVSIVSIILTANILLIARAPRAVLPSAQESMSFSIEGKITQQKGNQLTVNTQGNIVFRVVYNEKTSVTREDGSAGTPQDLSVGARVHVDGKLTESGIIIAQKISIRSELSGKEQ